MNQNTLRPTLDKEYKLFLVEVDDDNRERVLAGRASSCEITTKPEYADIHSGHSDFAVSTFKVSEEVTLTLNMVPSPDGTYFRIENFAEEDDES